jgi:hypothetical protein
MQYFVYITGVLYWRRKMNRIILLFSVLAIFLIFAGCKAPSCTTLSWEEAKIEETGFDIKYSAGKMCDNISDYYDISSKDIKRSGSAIEKLKMSLISTCIQTDEESGEDVEVECPEYVFETIEFGNIIACKFDTPPSENEDCAPGGVTFHTTSTSEYFQRVGWSYLPPAKIKESDVPESFFSFREDGVSMVGKFEDDSNVRIEFAERENNDGYQQRKKYFLNYSVETKE